MVTKSYTIYIYSDREDSDWFHVLHQSGENFHDWSVTTKTLPVILQEKEYSKVSHWERRLLIAQMFSLAYIVYKPSMGDEEDLGLLRLKDVTFWSM